MKKILVLLFCILLLLTSCTWESEETEKLVEFGGTPKGRGRAVALATEQCTVVMDALFAGDGDTLCEIGGWDRTREFDSFFRELGKHAALSRSYLMEALEVRGTKENGIWMYAVTFRVTCSNKKVFRITGFWSEGNERLDTFEIYMLFGVEAENRISETWRFAHHSIFLLSLGFYIWMLVDMWRRSMSKGQKVLWTFLCLLTAGFSVSYCPGDFSLTPLIGWMFSLKDRMLVGNLLTLDIYLPVGAMVYFFLRKRLTLKYLAKRKKYYDAQAPLDFTIEEKQ